MAKSLRSDRPKDGQNGGECVAYAGVSCFGVRFGAYTARDIWYNNETNTGGTLPYTKYSTMPSPPCCIVWENTTAGHVGVIESSSGSGSNKTYTYSDSNRASKNTVKVLTNQSEDDIKNLLPNFLGYVQFDD